MRLLFSAGQLIGLPAPTAEEDAITFASLLCSGSLHGMHLFSFIPHQ